MNIFTLPQSAGGVLLGVAILLTAGFLMTRLTRRLHLPNVTGYILAGILVGPYALNLIPAWLSGGMEFVTDLALSYIAFSAGRYFRIADLKRSGGKVLAVTLAEALCAAVAVTLTMIFVFRLSVPFALLLGAIGCATAPASTIMTIRQYRAKGPFVNLLLQVTALDDAVALTAFSVCTAVVNALQTGHIQFADVALPLLWNLGAVALGLALAVLLRWLAGQGHSQAHTLVLVNAVLLFLSGLCSTLGISTLLACMALGAGYVNLGGEKRLFKRMDKFSPPFLLLFFALSGLRLNIPSLATAGVIGVAYFFVRIAGKYAGASSGAALCRADPSIIKYLGLALTPQAGVSIGLAVLGQRMLPAAEGTMLATIILSSAVLYELTGPACAKLALLRSGATPRPATRQPARGHGRMPSMPDTGDTQEPPRAAG